VVLLGEWRWCWMVSLWEIVEGMFLKVGVLHEDDN